MYPLENRAWNRCDTLPTVEFTLGGSRMNFRLAEYGEVFSTRPRGLDLRRQLSAQLSADETVSVSFESVRKVSQSFSDEFLGALVSEIGPERVRIEAEMAPAVERVLCRVLRRRGFADIAEIGAVAA